MAYNVLIVGVLHLNVDTRRSGRSRLAPDLHDREKDGAQYLIRLADLLWIRMHWEVQPEAKTRTSEYFRSVDVVRDKSHIYVS